MGTELIHPNGGTLRPWRPGQSGNPGGRPKGLPEYVRRKCGRNGQKLIDALIAIAFGTDADRRALFGERVPYPSLKDRMVAIELLLTRGFGRPAQTNDPVAPVASEKRDVIVINLPRPPRALEGREVVYGLYDKNETDAVRTGAK
jgi:hypothetical protein